MQQETSCSTLMYVFINDIVIMSQYVYTLCLKIKFPPLNSL